MKGESNYKVAVAIIGTWWTANVGAPITALRYGAAAQRDERQGFPYTAAMEWRKVAELVPNTRAADYAWARWEAIMQLPRRLAGPLGGTSTLPVRKVKSATQLVVRHFAEGAA